MQQHARKHYNKKKCALQPTHSLEGPCVLASAPPSFAAAVVSHQCAGHQLCGAAGACVPVAVGAQFNAASASSLSTHRPAVHLKLSADNWLRPQRACRLRPLWLQWLLPSNRTSRKPDRLDRLARASGPRSASSHKLRRLGRLDKAAMRRACKGMHLQQKHHWRHACILALYR